MSAGAPTALRRFLVDFDAPAAGGARARSHPGTATPVRPLFGTGPALDALPEVQPAADRADAVAAAVAAAVAEALAGAGRAQAAALAEAAARHAAELESRLAAELAAARARWAAGEGAALAAGFRAAADAATAALGDAAAAALEPLLREAARAAAVDGLRAAMADLLLAGLGGTVSVSGPADLLDALRQALDAAGIDAGAMRFAASDAAEVVVAADHSRVETRLAAWAGALGRRAAGPAGVDHTADEPAAGADTAGEEAA